MNTRLKQFIAAENITQSQFADTIRVVRASVSHVLSGRNNPGYDFIKAIMVAYPNLNIEWLMLGKGKMYKETQADTDHVVPVQYFQHPEGSLFYDDDTYPVEDDFMPPPAQNPLPAPEIVTENRIPERTVSAGNKMETVVNQRKVSKIIIFFDDGSYQEMQ